MGVTVFVGVNVGVTVFVGVNVGVTVGVSVIVGVIVGVGVFVGVGVGVQEPQQPAVSPINVQNLGPSKYCLDVNAGHGLGEYTNPLTPINRPEGTVAPCAAHPIKVAS